MYKDIIVSMDKGEVTALALHDMSAVDYSFKRVYLELLNSFSKLLRLIEKNRGPICF